MNLDVRLTPREQEVLPLMLKGITYKEMASDLNIKEDTARKHSERIMYKYGCARRTEFLSKYYDKLTKKSFLPQGA